MTAQIGNKFRLDGESYTFVAQSRKLEFHPEEYGLKPAPACTACWDGYWCVFDVKDGELLLTELYIHTEDGHYPPICGVLPEREPDSEKPLVHLGHRVYRNLGLRVPYTGKLLVGSGFLPQYYIHGGYQKAWAFEDLRELVFREGRLIYNRDQNAAAEKMRRACGPDEKTGYIRILYFGRFIRDWDTEEE